VNGEVMDFDGGDDQTKLGATFRAKLGQGKGDSSCLVVYTEGIEWATQGWG
jgi:hypothetical protein